MNDKVYTLHLEPANKKRKEKFQKSAHKNGYSHKPTHSKPVIQMDMDGNRLHWYISSDEAARKLDLHGRNIRKVCDGERNHTGGFRFKWDERFLT